MSEVVEVAELPAKDWAEIERRARATRAAGIGMAEGGALTLIPASLAMTAYPQGSMPHLGLSYGVALPAAVAAVSGVPLAVGGSLQEARALRAQGHDVSQVPAILAITGIAGTLAWSAVPLVDPSLAELASYGVGASFVFTLYTVDLQIAFNCRAAGMRRGFGGIGCRR
ncbi:MAG: hypothetical protein ACOZNI_00225 [Myxococcota bacterium]